MPEIRRGANGLPDGFRPIIALSAIVAIALYGARAGQAQQPPPQAEKPATTAGQPTTAPTGHPPGTGDTNIDPEALKRLIELKLKEMPAVPAPAQPPASPPGMAGPPGPHSIAPGAQPRPTTQPGTGCGDTPSPDLDLNPPPPDQPQPRWACERTIIDYPAVWRGQPCEYVFKVRNEGEGVLNIRLKGG